MLYVPFNLYNNNPNFSPSFIFQHFKASMNTIASTDKFSRQKFENSNFGGLDGGWFDPFCLGESMKRPPVTDSVSDIFELDDSQPMAVNAIGSRAAAIAAASAIPASTANGASSAGNSNLHQAQAQHHRHDQYLQHNCNPRHNHNINAMSIETDVWQNGNFNNLFCSG